MHTTEHKVLDALAHVWPYVSGIAVTLFAGVRLWWKDRKETKDRINDNTEAIRILISQTVTKEDLHACRQDIRKTDEKHLALVFEEIKELRGELKKEIHINAQQHQDIMEQIIRLHGGHH